jgi:hypothetical protein
MTIMRDNEFDKGVQEKMEEFRLPPSAPVWEEVERRIRERKRRRVIIFWFCLAGLLMAGLGGWWIWQNNEPVVLTAANEQKSSSVTPAASGTATNTRKQKEGPATETTEKKKSETDHANLPSAGNEPQSTVTVKSAAGINTPVSIKNIPTKKTEAVAVKTNVAVTTLTASAGKKSKRTTAPKSKVNATEPDKDKPVATQKNTNEVQDVTVVTVSTDPTPVPVAAPLTIATPVAVSAAKSADTIQAVTTVEQKPVPVPRKNKKSKWQTGLVFAFGEARLTQGGLTLFSEKSFDALQSGVSSGNGNFSSQSFADSVPLTGPGIQAGLFVKRQVGRKIFFSSGINLAFYSGRQRVGEKVDSVRRISTPFNTDTRSGFYRAGNSEKYANHYYYLQLPLLLHWQLNKGTKWPAIEWENGFVPSVLFGSRALVYDPAGRVFFRDKSVYNKFSLVYQTGFTARFASRTKHPLTAGFYYNYHLSRLQKINPPDFNHQSSYGIQLRWLLKK